LSILIDLSLARILLKIDEQKYKKYTNKHRYLTDIIDILLVVVLKQTKNIDFFEVLTLSL